MVDTRAEWDAGTFELKAKHKPRIRCVCGQIVCTSTINNLQQGQRLGCPDCASHPWLGQRWDTPGRFEEFKDLCAPLGMEVLETCEEFCAVPATTRAVRVRCVHHGTTGVIHTRELIRGGGMQCSGCVTFSWSARYDEAAALCRALKLRLAVSREKWTRLQPRDVYKPRVWCDCCGAQTSHQSIKQMVQGSRPHCCGADNASRKKVKRKLDAFPLRTRGARTHRRGAGGA